MSVDAVELDAECAGDSTPKVRLLTLASLDGRTAAAKLVRELIAAIADDLGGSEQLTEGTRQLVQRAAVLGAFIEDCEARWIGGEEFETNEYLAAINAQRRVLATIGLDRRAKDITPSLAAYIATKRAVNSTGGTQDSFSSLSPRDTPEAEKRTSGLAIEAGEAVA